MKNFSIKHKMALLLATIILISNVFLGILNYNNSKSMASDIIIKNNDAELQNISDYYFDKLIDDMEFIVAEWADSDFIKNYEKDPETPRIVRSIPYDFYHVYDQWTGLTRSMHDITWFYFALESDGSIFIAPVDPSMPDSYDARIRDWYKGTVNQSGNIYWTEPYVDAGNSGKILQTVSKAVYNDGQLKGVVALDIELTKFTEIIENLSLAKSSSIFLVNQNNDIIAHNSDQLSFYKESFIDTIDHDTPSSLETIDNTDYVLSWSPLDINGWKLVAVTKTSYKDDLMLMKNQIMLIVLSTIIISILFSYVGFKNIFVHLNSLVDITKQFGQGKFSARCRVDSNDEFRTLSNSMNNMLDYIETLIYERDEDYIKTVKALANAIEASDEYTRGHCDRVGDMSIKIGLAMQLDTESLRQLEFACILHDIGKIGIPDHVLNKTSALDNREYTLIKSHPKIGYDILKDIHFLDKAKDIVLQHHERVDGQGYPDGLKSEDICLEAKILAVADAYDAMSSQRVYRSGILTTEEIVAELRRCSKTQFDHDVVEHFVHVTIQENYSEVIDGETTG